MDEPCTRNRIGRGGSPVLGAPTRLRHRLSGTSPLRAQYSAVHSGPSVAAAGAGAWAAANPDARLAPRPRPAPLRIARRASPSANGFALLMSSLLPDFVRRRRRVATPAASRIYRA